jgi:hypothetical protein
VRTWDVVEELAAASDARTYLQLVTPTTAIEHSARTATLPFATSEPLTYQVIGHGFPGVPADMPTFDDIEPTMAGTRFDIVFTDPWHTIDHSRRALRWAFDRIAPDGWLVVHDCWPTAPELLGPYGGYPAAWCGDTWRAFQELARAQRNPWCVIDSDFGIGVIGPITDHRLERIVDDIPAEPAAQWEWLVSHRGEPWLTAPTDWSPNPPANRVGAFRADR